MQNKSYQPLILTYFLLVIIELFAELIAGLNGSRLAIYIVKPLLMPVLVLITLRAVNTNPISKLYKLIIAALFFSWLGDVFLMLELPNANLFLPGLVSFLIAHIFYIIAFRSIQKSKQSKNLAFAPVLIALYGLSLIHI